jgi:hypothetical protein
MGVPKIDNTWPETFIPLFQKVIFIKYNQWTESEQKNGKPNDILADGR